MAATTVSRSSRAHNLHYRPQHDAPAHYSSPSLSHAPTSTRSHSHKMTAAHLANQPRPPKRPLEDQDQEVNSVKRKRSSHFVVEIPAKLASQRFQQHNNTGRPHAGNRPSPLSAPHLEAATTKDPTRHSKPAVASSLSLPAVTITSTSADVATTTAPPLSKPVDVRPTVGKIPPKVPEHKKKVANGLKHELDRLQPSPTDKETQGRRKLRSQEATRFKSELSAYFPDYDEVIGNDPKEMHLLNPNTPIVIVDTQSEYDELSPFNPTTSTTHYHTHDLPPILTECDPLFSDVFDAQRFNVDSLQTLTKSDIDPLTETVYAQPHKKAQRLERSLRNAERSRAQHERDQVIRLLEGLQGPEWLKILGVNGVTEGKKKSFEAARAYFIKGCQAIIDKFKAWAAEEKRRKLEKGRLARQQTASEPSEPEKEKSEPKEEQVIPDSQEEVDEDVDMIDADAEVPDTASDVDASIARQLREEALAAAKAKSRTKGRSIRGVSGQAVVKPPPAPPPPKEFKSFFARPSQRSQALNLNRRHGRAAALAWGQPLPAFPEEVHFKLPEEYRDAGIMRANARKRRTEQRHRK